MIKFYSTGCPQCNQIKMMMDSKEIEYEYITDIEIIMEVADKYNIMSAPFAEVFDEIMTTPKLTKYIQTL